MLRKIAAIAVLSCGAMNVAAEDVQFTHANLRVTYVENTHAFRIQYTTDEGSSYSPLITNCFPEATYDDAAGNSYLLSTATLTEMNYAETDINDEQFGKGSCYSFTFSSPEETVTLTEHFYAYDDCAFLLADVELTSANATIKSNYLAPLYTATTYRILPASKNNRMLKVPYDNDGFVRYHRYPLSATMTSYEVTSIYSGDERRGAVIGSIDHDHWKSGVYVKATDNSNIAQLKAYCGVSDSETRDVLPHGKREGKNISSARFIIDYSADWRDGMETFAWACNRVAPGCETWQEGTPMGWQSWGVLAEKSNYTDVSEIADYYANILQPKGFHNSKGNIILSLDASDGLNDTERKELCTKGATRNQFVGCYSTPFSLWWDEASLDRYSETIGGVKYSYRDAVIKVNGQPYKYDGAYALDPTHPITKQSIVNFVNSAASKGLRYIKCDFVNAGMIQADSYFKEGITTAVEAYNEGMRYLANRASAKNMFIALSIAPLFPYQYANSRRVACDTWGSIGHSEYAMNAISGGWWTSHLYQYNDPDHVVFIGTGDQLNNSEGENRARFTSAVCTGMVLVADNFSTSNVSGRGNPGLSKSRAQKLMTNEEVNAVADLGVSFRPLYGCKEFQGSEDKAESFYVHRTDDYLYLAGFNFAGNATSGTIELKDLGLNPEDFDEVKELWTQEQVTVPSTGLSFSIPAKDARIYRFSIKAVGVKQVHAKTKNSNSEYDLSGRAFAVNSIPQIAISEKGKVMRKR